MILLSSGQSYFQKHASDSLGSCMHFSATAPQLPLSPDVAIILG